jgi:colanic acid biosynthesis glycosyl transferase WcaI
VTDKNKKITYLSPYFWPEEIGSGPYATDLAKYLGSVGHFVTTVSFRPHYPNISLFPGWADGTRDTENFEGTTILRVPVDAGGAGGGGGFKGRIRNDIRYLLLVARRAFRGEFKGSEAVVAYVPSILTLYGAKCIRWRTGARILAVVHDIESGLASSLGIASGSAMLRLMRLVERIGLNFADHVVVLTEGMKEELEDIGCNKPITILSIWANATDFVPIDATARPKLTYSGNFGKKQNLDQLLPLFERLSAENVAADVIMRGGGSEHDRIENEIKTRGIKNVSFLPLVPSDQFMQALQGVNIHLVPQALNVANYALPSKLFSIMSAGRPFVCIAEKDSPLDRLAQRSGAGLCIQPGDEAALFEAVVSLLADPVQQNEMGKSGWEFVKQNMNRDTILASYEDILMDLPSPKQA